MSNDTPRNDKRTTTDRRIDVAWNTPATRSQPIFLYEVTCAHCGRHFTIETMQPKAPLYCLKEDNPECYRQRKAAYMKEYRERQK